MNAAYKSNNNNNNYTKNQSNKMKIDLQQFKHAEQCVAHVKHNNTKEQEKNMRKMKMNKLHDKL